MSRGQDAAVQYTTASVTYPQEHVGVLDRHPLQILGDGAQLLAPRRPGPDGRHAHPDGLCVFACMEMWRWSLLARHIQTTQATHLRPKKKDDPPTQYKFHIAHAP